MSGTGANKSKRIKQRTAVHASINVLPDFERVWKIAQGTGLPGLERSQSFAKPSIKVRGKFVGWVKEPGILAVHCSMEWKELLLRDRRGLYFETPHYEGWPAVQIKLSLANDGDIAEAITRAWKEQAPKRLLASLDEPKARVRQAINSDIASYNTRQVEPYRAICNALAVELNRGLPEAVSKVWHGGPVWFLEENPIVGYWVRKNGVQLLFWSGQSFEEAGLRPEGKFKAAEARLADFKSIDTPQIQRWLKEARRIQWDYKNIVKRRGVLEKIGNW